MMGSSNQYVQRWVSVSHEDALHRSFAATLHGEEVPFDPAKVLFTFLKMLWQSLWQHKLHPGFDIRTYLSSSMDTFLDMGGQRGVSGDKELLTTASSGLGRVERKSSNE